MIIMIFCQVNFEGMCYISDLFRVSIERYSSELLMNMFFIKSNISSALLVPTLLANLHHISTPKTSIRLRFTILLRPHL